MNLNHDSSGEDDTALEMKPVFVGKNAIKEQHEESTQPSEAKTMQTSKSKKGLTASKSVKGLTASKSTKGIKTKQSKTKEKSILTNKFKALLAANLKKHSLNNV